MAAWGLFVLALSVWGISNTQQTSYTVFSYNLLTSMHWQNMPVYICALRSFKLHQVCDWFFNDMQKVGESHLREICCGGTVAKAAKDQPVQRLPHTSFRSSTKQCSDTMMNWFPSSLLSSLSLKRATLRFP